ncbi:MAG: translation initiation factor eIF-5A.2 [Hyperionvirus sp.]|uniref:Translation initiation factor eIF-5A.2 n=1 Tax=Hyperionvirus sp. TaxID=2487770 RepID=A0A3G5A6X5_9VIRU|nr:MAG: translation initiation factor eIF-5A.2 [Hyperionvirus sp.]
MSSKCDIDPIEGSQIKVGQYVIIRLQPCRIVKVNHVKNGKHGGAKFKISGFNMLTSKNIDYTGPGDERVLQFKPIKTKLTLLNHSKNVFECVDDQKVVTSISVKPTEKYEEFIENYDADKEYAINILTVPILIEEDDYNDIHLLESYKEIE